MKSEEALQTVPMPWFWPCTTVMQDIHHWGKQGEGIQGYKTSLYLGVWRVDFLWIWNYLKIYVSKRKPASCKHCFLHIHKAHSTAWHCSACWDIKWSSLWSWGSHSLVAYRKSSLWREEKVNSDFMWRRQRMIVCVVPCHVELYMKLISNHHSIHKINDYVWLV